MSTTTKTSTNPTATTTTKQRWLVAHDLGPLGDAAADSAAALAKDGAVLLLHIHPVPLREPWNRDGKQTWAAEEEQRKMLQAAAQRLRQRHPGLDVDIEVLAGDPTTRIVEEAERTGAGYIVVGTHDRRGVARLALGSVAEAVVHRAHAPVLVVKGTRPS